ncbi:MAG: glycosyl hydrolase family 65 protein, partial [Candidatus Microthrix parvicella]
QGFAGMRDLWGTMRFDPRLPEGWAGISFRLHRLGCRLLVELTPETISFTLLDGEPVHVEVGDSRFRVGDDQPTVVTLADQGPRIPGVAPRMAEVGVVPHVAHDTDITDLHGIASAGTNLG